MASNLIRNAFDQYRHRENRLTHAFVHAVAHDKGLAREFVKFATGAGPPAGCDLSVSCQVAPGDSPELLTLEKEPDDPSVPDAWIFDERSTWALVCECKITADLRVEQLRRHLQAARRRGFDQVTLLVITAHEEQPLSVRSLAKGGQGLRVSWRSWAQVYSFFSRHNTNPFVSQFVDYIRVLEGYLMADGYDGPPLTAFEGIQFGQTTPYSEAAAKVVLRALMKDLRPRLEAILPVDTGIRRPALAGAWDIIGFQTSSPGGSFTEHPHLTVWVSREEACVQVTLPNNARREYWARLQGYGKDEIQEALTAVVQRAKPISRLVGRGVWEPRLLWSMGQVHFYGRRSEIRDGDISFDLESILPPTSPPTSGVRIVPAWLDAALALLKQRGRANFELALRARFPLVDGSVSRNHDFIDALVRSVDAFGPFIDVLFGRHL